MSLQFYIGRSGSGKSTVLYKNIIEDSIKNPKQNYILIVPDQFTLDTQKTVIEMHPRHGTMNIDIVSFHRLAWRVFEEISKDPGVVLEDLGKSMVLSRILGKRQKELLLFGSSRNKIGFIDELKSLLSEFYQYRIGMEELKAQQKKEREGSLLSEKLSELIVIMEEFEAFMGKDYIVAEQLLSVLGQRAPESMLLKDSIICLDGFTGFTPVQYELLNSLLPLCKEMIVTVTMDEKELGFQKILDYELFASSKEMIQKLKKIALDRKIPVLESIVLTEENVPKNRFYQNPELAYLEKNLFRPFYKPNPKKTESLSVHYFQDPEEEAFFTADYISRLVREKRYRYRDIAVISGDMERYDMRLKRIFDDYHIPCFLDDTKGIRNHPLAECIRGLFALVEYDFNYESVCNYAKNGMSSITKEEADALDNYLLASGIRGYRGLSKEFTKKPGRIGEAVFQKAENARKQMIEEVGELMKVFRKKTALVEDYLKALYFYMEKMEYEQKLSKEEKRFEAEGDFVMMKAYGQIFPAVIHLIDKIHEILGPEEMELGELQKIVDAGLDEMKLGVIPPGIDQVVIGDTQRTRLTNIKVLFFLGVNEGVIPKPAKGGGILSDMDREKLTRDDFSLAPSAKQNTALEQFYLYLNLTKPQDRLYLTLAGTDQEGKSIRPSYLLERLLLIFPNMTVVRDEKERKNHAYTIKSILPDIRDGLNRFLSGEEEKEDQEMFYWLFQTEEGKKWISLALDGRFYKNEESPLSLQAAKAIYGLDIGASVTRLESYAGCAFAHFLRYGLMLAERAKYQLRSADLGQILHRCLELVSKEAGKEPGGLKRMEDKKRDQLVEDCLRIAVENYGSSIFHSTARNEACIDRMERLSKRTVWAIQKQLLSSDFEPEEFEWKFQSRKDLEAVRFSLDHQANLELMGVVDRIDCYEEDESLYLKIIDYKSGMQSFQLEDIYNGLQLQLVVYLNAAVEKAKKDKKKRVVPGGIFYFHIQDPLVEEDSQKSVEEELLSEFSLSGLVLADPDIVNHLDWEGQRSIPVSITKKGEFSARSSVATEEQFEALSTYVKKQLVRYGNEIIGGNISIAPYRTEKKTACDYCEYRGVCGFDPSLPGNQYRRIRKKDKDEIWKQLEREGGLY
ncbi:MAG: helicase-exonuclease AddAB subunit AddB [Lachnospiraceae bacterium]|nr:helicase-exonuclease AddAB subunit AddB [Lachnospiraceae bacterium]